MEYHLDALTPDQELSAKRLVALSCERIVHGMQAARGERPYGSDPWDHAAGVEQEIAIDYYTDTDQPTSLAEATRYVLQLDEFTTDTALKEIVQ